MIRTIMRLWTRIETILVGLLIFAALFVFLGGALLRAFAPVHSVDWAEEISLYCVIWATMLAGSSLVAENRHINTEILVGTLPLPVRRAVGWGMTLLTTGFCLAMAVYGKQAFDFALMLDERSASTLRVRQGYAVFLAMPVGMALILGRIGLMIALGDRPFAGHPPSEKDT